MDKDLKKVALLVDLISPLLDSSTDELIDEWTGIFLSEEEAGEMKRFLENNIK